MAISDRANEVFSIIKAFLKKHGTTPTYAEIGKLMGISSPMVFRYVRELRRADKVEIVGKKIQVGDEIPYSTKMREIMEIIAENPDISQADLARKLGVSAPTMFQHIENLKKLSALDKDMKIIDKTLG